MFYRVFLGGSGMHIFFIFVGLLFLLAGCATSVQTPAVEPHVPAQCTSGTPRSNVGTHSLSLSGGGYRAMLFHVGAIWRLHELGLLDDVRIVSSVSGGSITAAVLAIEYERIRNDSGGNSECYRALVANPLMRLAQSTIDWKASTLSLVTPTAPGNILAGFYKRRILGATRLVDLPKHPSFLFQATNLHTGSVWTFGRQSIGDPQFGSANPKEMLVADAVAASSAFPPILSPYRLSAFDFNWENEQIDPEARMSREYIERRHGNASGPQSAPTVSETIRILRGKSILLTDGGVADNLGIEGIWYSQGTMLVSDGGSEARAVLTPPTDWIGQLAHVTELIHTQPTQIRYKLIIEGFRTAAMGGRDGSFWAISKPLPIHREDCYNYAPRMSESTRSRLAAVPTRLAALEDKQVKELINLGYHTADWNIPYLNALMAARLHSISAKLPFPDAPLWTEEDIQKSSKAC